MNDDFKLPVSQEEWDSLTEFEQISVVNWRYDCNVALARLNDDFNRKRLDIHADFQQRIDRLLYDKQKAKDTDGS